MITAIILEDEKNVGKVMQRLLERLHPEVKVLAVCYNIKEAEEMLLKAQPDLMFLDIELGKSQTCFDLLNKLSVINFGIIFTTAYSRPAIQALKLSGVDFLLKPIDDSELGETIAKFNDQKRGGNLGRIESLLYAWNNPGNQLNKIHFSTIESERQVSIADIIFCENVDGHTCIVLNNGEKITSTRSIKEYEDMLTPYRFYRINKSYLVNLHHVKDYIDGVQGITLMSNNALLITAHSIKNLFLKKLKVVRTGNPISKPERTIHR